MKEDGKDSLDHDPVKRARNQRKRKRQAEWRRKVKAVHVPKYRKKPRR